MLTRNLAAPVILDNIEEIATEGEKVRNKGKRSRKKKYGGRNRTDSLKCQYASTQGGYKMKIGGQQ